jgi:GABA(A) receptor-associated protein
MFIIKTNNSFKEKYTFRERYNEVTSIIQKYPDRIPVICEKLDIKQNIPELDKIKYLLPYELTIGHFMIIIRKRIHLQPGQAIYLSINGFILPTSSIINHIYYEHKDDDGFLYIKYSLENTFG